MPRFFSRFGADPERSLPPALDDLPAAVYCGELGAPVWGMGRDLTSEGVCIATRSPLPVATGARVVLHGPSAPVSVEVQGLWQQYEDGEPVILTGFRFTRLSRADRRTIVELSSANVRRIASVLVDLPSAGLDREDALALARIVHRRNFRSGRVVYGSPAQGQHAGSLFVVQEGQVSLHLAGDASRRMELTVVEEGGVFGTLASAAPAPLREVAVAECDTRLFEIEQSPFDRLRDRNPRLALRLLTAVFRSASLRHCQALFPALEPTGARAPHPGPDEVARLDDLS